MIEEWDLWKIEWKKKKRKKIFQKEEKKREFFEIKRWWRGKWIQELIVSVIKDEKGLFGG